MRLSIQQRHLILAIARRLVGRDVEVRLFGSRLDDTRRGGDLDLLLVSPTPISLLARAELKQALEESLQLPVDIVTYTQDDEPTPFQAIALHQARPITAEDAA
ncbi:nucleotidyltransferase domain-containing protein [Halomonas ramblicola]|uniref:nucleotidyltransferase domain-containing protein n=1 Tax=Halomonas ramblicola TaxID=747349 RepID=UPI0025B3C816|nr:nucleotidyltransferase domain-containing protein [Halomonas ramblicola]MDN3523065.1 nucleotidyltransferase domain-containing protein [Halomonas ramblicola]